MKTGDKDRLFEIIDREAVDPVEQRDSKILYEVLLARRNQLGAQAVLPAVDEELSSRIHREAERRSQEITSLRRDSGATVPEGGRPIPLWIWLLAGLMLVGAIIAWQLWP